MRVFAIGSVCLLVSPRLRAWIDRPDPTKTCPRVIELTPEKNLATSRFEWVTSLFSNCRFSPLFDWGLTVATP